MRTRQIEYTSKLFDNPIKGEKTGLLREEMPLILMKEFDHALKTMKNSRAVRNNGIVVKTIQNLDDESQTLVQQFLNQIQMQDKLPKYCKQPILIPLPKIPNARQCGTMEPYAQCAIDNHRSNNARAKRFPYYWQSAWIYIKFKSRKGILPYMKEP